MISKPDAKLGRGETPTLSDTVEQTISFAACLLGTVASVGGFMLGYARYEFSSSLGRVTQITLVTFVATYSLPD